MMAHSSDTERRGVFLLAGIWPVALTALLLLWMAIVAGRGALLVVQSFGLALTGEPQRPTLPPLLAASGLVVLFCVGAALTARRFRPAATIPVACGSGGLVLFAAAAGSGSLGPLLLVLAFFVVAWLLGHGVLY